MALRFAARTSHVSAAETRDTKKYPKKLILDSSLFFSPLNPHRSHKQRQADLVAFIQGEVAAFAELHMRGDVELA